CLPVFSSCSPPAPRFWRCSLRFPIFGGSTRLARRAPSPFYQSFSSSATATPGSACSPRSSLVGFLTTTGLVTMRIHKLYGAAFYVLSGYTLYYSLGTSGATNQSSEAVENTLGAVSGLINLALYASPLETIKNVFETKDASTIPITISAFFLANGIVWEVHSIAEDDMLVRDRSRVVCHPSSATSKDLSKLFQYN
ncbi:hypothetical protein JG688_00011415, partial [Phytophthora aleatoria]